MKILAIAVACAACFRPASAQLSFDVASVKPGVSGDRPELTLSLGRLHGRNVQPKALIAEAYQVTEAQVIGPDWLPYETYNLEAKSAGPATLAQTRQMLQGLLADRFHLAFHHNKKEMTVYALSVATGMSGKLRAADKTGCDVEPSPTNPCQHFDDSPDLVFTGKRVSMTALCHLISRLLYNPCVDKTGLDGVYDLTLDLTRAGFSLTGPGEVDGLTATVTALRDQLGLKLERTRSAVDVLVIEHVERPSAN